MKNVANPTSLIVSLFDADGDRFTSELAIPYSPNNEWNLYSVVLSELVQPDWVTETGDRRLDMRGIVAIQLLEKFHDGQDHTTWFDDLYLGGMLEWP